MVVHNNPSSRHPMKAHVVSYLDPLPLHSKGRFDFDKYGYRERG